MTPRYVIAPTPAASNLFVLIKLHLFYLHSSSADFTSDFYLQSSKFLVVLQTHVHLSSRVS